VKEVLSRHPFPSYRFNEQVDYFTSRKCPCVQIIPAIYFILCAVPLNRSVHPQRQADSPILNFLPLPGETVTKLEVKLD
jgi:hypothetical protein